MNYYFYDKVNSMISHYNPKRYWKFKRSLALKEGCKLFRLWKLLYLKRSDSFNCASLGHRLDRNGGSLFKSTPFLPHGIKGIFISDYAVIGSGAVIYQGVTIGKNGENCDAPIIGDNVFVGAGAVIIGKIRIGNNVKIGANCVVFFDVPDNCTVVLEHPRVIMKRK